MKSLQYNKKQMEIDENFQMEIDEENQEEPYEVDESYDIDRINGEAASIEYNEYNED